MRDNAPPLAAALSADVKRIRDNAAALSVNLKRMRANAAAVPPDVKRMRDNAPPPAAALSADIKRIRVISDAFPLSQTAADRWGRYGCSEQGLVLVAGDRREMEQAVSGSLPELPFPKEGKRDPKTGALVILCG
jgi:hypothetical protein